MSWQKCKSFSKCSNLEAKKAKTSNFAIKELKGRTIISNEQNIDKKAFYKGFMHLKIKIKEKLPGGGGTSTSFVLECVATGLEN